MAGLDPDAAAVDITAAGGGCGSGVELSMQGGHGVPPPRAAGDIEAQHGGAIGGSSAAGVGEAEPGGRGRASVPSPSGRSSSRRSIGSGGGTRRTSMGDVENMVGSTTLDDLKLRRQVNKEISGREKDDLAGASGNAGPYVPWDVVLETCAYGVICAVLCALARSYLVYVYPEMIQIHHPDASAAEYSSGHEVDSGGADVAIGASGDVTSSEQEPLPLPPLPVMRIDNWVKYWASLPSWLVFGQMLFAGGLGICYGPDVFRVVRQRRISVLFLLGCVLQVFVFHHPAVARATNNRSHSLPMPLWCASALLIIRWSKLPEEASANLEAVEADAGKRKALAARVRGMVKVGVVAVLMWVPFFMFKLGSMIARIKSDWGKAAVATVLWPLFREVAFGLLRESHRTSFPGDHSLRLVLWFPLMLFATMVGRFAITSIKNNVVVLAVSLLQAVQEVVMRLTGPQRDRVILAIWRWWHGIANDAAWGEFHKEGLKENRSQVLLSEMVVEYTGIVLAPLFFYTYSSLRVNFDLGYEGSAPVKGEAILQAFLIQFLIEIPVDMACCMFEMHYRKLPVREVWKQQRFFTPKVLLAQVGSSFLALNIFTVGFGVRYTGCGHTWHSDTVVEVPICEQECRDKLNYSVYEAICSGWKLTGLP